MKKKLTNHHILPAHLGYKRTPENIVRLTESVHRAVHTLLDYKGVAQKPREQIQTLISILGKALTDEFKNDIDKVLSEEDNEYYYKGSILVPKHYGQGIMQ